MPSKKLKTLLERDRRIENKYNRFCERKQKKQADNAKNIWNSNRRTMEPLLKAKQKAESQLSAIRRIDRKFLDKRRSAALISSNAKSSIQRLQVRVLAKIKPIPKMNTWVLINRNYYCEAESETDNENSGGEQEDDCGQNSLECLTDVEFVELFDALVQAEGNNKNAPGQSPFDEMPLINLGKNKDADETAGNKKPFPTPEIFEAVSRIIPNEGSPDEIRNNYIELTTGVDPIVSQSGFTPNIDGPDAQSISREKTLDSYHRLFCRRCFIYDCRQHIVHHDPRGEPEPNLQKRRKVDVQPPPSHPCSNNCYMLLEAYGSDTSTLSSINPSDFSSLNVMNTVDSEWSGSDQSMFRVLIEVLPNDFCVIATALQNKTCQQVHDFSEKEPAKVFPEVKPIVHEQSNNIKRKLNGLRNKKTEPADSDNFSPCNHEGDCNNSCSCKQGGTRCEKFCNCSEDCPNRFLFCTCKGLCNTNHCPCFKAKRECDSDRCSSCSAQLFDKTKAVCHNMNIQRGVKKRLMLVQSEVAGWGTCIKDGAEKNEFIGEYCGEVISQKEAEHRGEKYDEEKCSYLFNLNNEFVVDAARKGNLLRFVNHSINPNCYAKVMMVNGDHRIGYFAQRAIKANEELFIDYGYNELQKKEFLPVEQIRIKIE